MKPLWVNKKYGSLPLKQGHFYFSGKFSTKKQIFKLFFLEKLAMVRYAGYK
jgi:hypothetical protein